MAEHMDRLTDSYRDQMIIDQKTFERLVILEEWRKNMEAKAASRDKWYIAGFGIIFSLLAAILKQRLGI